MFETSEGNIVCRLSSKKMPPRLSPTLSTSPKANESGSIPRRGRNEDLFITARFSSRDSRLYDSGRRSEGTGMGGPWLSSSKMRPKARHIAFDKAGKLAMANAGPNTNGSQFFITLGANDWLTGKHTIFGEVVEGQSVAEKIVALPRGRNDKPNQCCGSEEGDHREGVDWPISTVLSS